MAEWTSDPWQDDVTAIVGDTWVVNYIMQDPATVPHDLTGVTWTASVRVEPGGTVIATPTVTTTDATAGKIEVRLPAATTALLVPGTYKWAARGTWPDATVKTVVEGAFIVRRAVVA